MRALPPRHPDYLRLMREKLRLERVLGDGGWGETSYSGRLKSRAIRGNPWLPSRSLDPDGLSEPLDLRRL